MVTHDALTFHEMSSSVLLIHLLTGINTIFVILSNVKIVMIMIRIISIGIGKHFAIVWLYVSLIVIKLCRNFNIYLIMTPLL